MSRFIVRRKSAETTDDAPLAEAMSRLSSPDYSALARVMLEGSNFASFSEITFDSDSSRTLHERKTLIVDGEQQAMQRLREEATQQYHVERLIEHSKAAVPFDMFRAAPLDLAEMLRAEPLSVAGVGAGQKLTVRVQGRGSKGYEALPHAQVHVFLAASGKVRGRLQMRTDATGIAHVSIASWYSVLAIVAYPYSDYAPAVQRGDQGRHVRLLCERLPRPDDGPTAWWHDAVGVPVGKRRSQDPRDRPIRVGVVDSGCGPHPCLGHVTDLGAFIDGSHDLNLGADSGTHGTHVCGTIGARTAESRTIPFGGISPMVELFSARVFPPDSDANQGDIADALDALVASNVELVNMSLGSPDPSDVLLDAIQAAYNEGTVCICAAGNESGPVSYPAAFTDTIAVSAIGKTGQVDASSLPAVPSDPGLFGTNGYYAADFTNYGPEIAMTAPGVGIIATVPARFDMPAPYAMMNGTSMATPIASGVIATLLANNRDYMLMAPSRDRSRFVHAISSVASRSIELPTDYEGNGVPNASGHWV